jgi:hypothetical protein
MSNMYPPPPRDIDLTAHKSKRRQRRSQSRHGIGYKAGKSDTPLGIVVAEFRFAANNRENISTIRAGVGDGGLDGIECYRNFVVTVGPISTTTVGVFRLS